ncbi:MAG: MSMEG_4193 family putative phosphomutase [Nostocoides sp.]
MTLCLLIRHGHSESNAAGVLSGRMPAVALTERGRAQAHAVGAALASVPLTALVSSPLERCLETAAAIAAGQQALAVTQDEELIECAYGAWTGRTLADLAKEPLWRQVQQRPETVTFPPSTSFASESFADMGERAVAAMARHDAAVSQAHGPDAVWAAVTHGDLAKSVVNDAVGAPFRHMQRLVIDPGSVTAIRYTAERPYLLGLNMDPTRVADLVRALAGSSTDAVPGGGAGGAAGD